MSLTLDLFGELLFLCSFLEFFLCVYMHMGMHMWVCMCVHCMCVNYFSVHVPLWMWPCIVKNRDYGHWGNGSVVKSTWSSTRRPEVGSQLLYYMTAQLPITPAPGCLVPSSGFWRDPHTCGKYLHTQRQACTHTDVQVCTCAHTHACTQIKIENKSKRLKNKENEKNILIIKKKKDGRQYEKLKTSSSDRGLLMSLPVNCKHTVTFSNFSWVQP